MVARPVIWRILWMVSWKLDQVFGQIAQQHPLGM
jgi:hypothetical protein